jgi:hypothetical protein
LHDGFKDEEAKVQYYMVSYQYFTQLENSILFKRIPRGESGNPGFIEFDIPQIELIYLFPVSYLGIQLILIF